MRAEHTAEVKIRRAIGAPLVDLFASKGHKHVQVVPVVARDSLLGTRRCHTHGLTTVIVVSLSMAMVKVSCVLHSG